MNKIIVSCKFVLRRFPKNIIFDYFFHLAHFLWAHGRMPRKKSMLFNDYLFFLKTSSRIENAVRQFTSDKQLVKAYASYVLGEDICPKTYRIIRDKSELIDFVPSAGCVLKPSHTSGCVVFKEPGEKLDKDEVLALGSALDRNLYNESRERNYKNLPPSIIVEERLGVGGAPSDYKVFCFNGVPKIVAVYTGRLDDLRVNFYDDKWVELFFNYQIKPLKGGVEKPRAASSMFASAKKLSSGLDIVRVDFYEVNGKCYLGEMTHVHAQGHAKFGSLSDERKFSEVLFGIG